MRNVAVPVGARRGLAPGAEVDFAVRRDDVLLTRPERQDSAGQAGIATRVRGVEYQGNFVKVLLDDIGGDGLVAYVPDRIFYNDPLAIGDVVMAGWQAEKARMLA
jgi:putative spermidine/putrescine transport system ATP-binding protein